MTKEEFEASYAKASSLTVEELRDLGGYVEPCDCEYEYCPGWQMMFIEKEVIPCLIRTVSFLI